MDQEIDDTHARWMHLNQEEINIWKKYDEEVSTTIVNASLADSRVSLFELYHALSIARRLCEIEKSPIDTSRSENFGMFQLGDSFETNIYGWGKSITFFLQQRLPQHPGRCMKGLSELFYIQGLCLSHPQGEVLHRCHRVFQTLRSTENFFEYLENAARLNYDLSNYPPIIRGSAAVNSWIIDKIAKRNFEVTSSLRPHLYDWTAFFEYPEAYRGFYVISACVKYIQTILSLYNRDRDFYDSIQTLMQEDPNSPGTIEKRADAWSRIQNNIVTYKSSQDFADLTAIEKSALSSIVNGTLCFRPPSKQIRSFVDSMKKEDSLLTLEGVQAALSEAEMTIDRLHKLLVLDQTLQSRYLAAYGDKTQEDQLDNAWRDLEVLRELGGRRVSEIQRLTNQTFETEYEPVHSYGFECKMITSDPTTCLDLKRIVNDQPSFLVFQEQIYYLGCDTDWIPQQLTYADPGNPIPAETQPDGSFSWDDTTIDRLRGNMPVLNDYRAQKDGVLYQLARVSFASIADIARIPKEMMELLTRESQSQEDCTSLHSRLKNAISLGGIRLQELPGLTLKDLEVIASPEAIEKYQQQNFTRGLDLLRSHRSHAEFDAGASTAADSSTHPDEHVLTQSHHPSPDSEARIKPYSF